MACSWRSLSIAAGDVAGARCPPARADTVPDMRLLVLQPHLRKLLAHLVHVEAEHAGSELLALLFLVRGALVGGFSHLRGIRARHDADAVVISDHNVTRLNALTGAHHRHIHRAEARLDGAL